MQQPLSPGWTRSSSASGLRTHIDVYLITGIPAAGKTTVARALAAQFPLGVHIEGDVLSFRFVVSGVPDPFDERSHGEWSRQMALRRRQQGMLASTYAEAGFVSAIDDVVAHPTGLEEILSPMADLAVGVVVLAPPLDVVAERDALRGTSSFARWRHLDGLLRTRMRGIGLWIEDGGLTVAEVVSEILSRPSEVLVQRRRTTSSSSESAS